MNIECDQIASKIAQFAIKCNNYDPAPTLEIPLPGSQAGLRIGHMGISTNTADDISSTHHSKVVRDYCKTKYNWSHTVMGTIHCEVVWIAQCWGSPTQFMHYSKVMHGLLPVMHMHSHTTGTSVCPGYDTLCETVEHMLICPNPHMHQAREDAFLVFWTKCQQMDLPMNFFTDINGYTKAILWATHPPEASSAILSLIFHQQDMIGGQGMMCSEVFW